MEKPQIFERGSGQGGYRVAMHDVREAKLIPGSMAYVMGQRMPDSQHRQIFLPLYFDTGDGASPDGTGNQLAVLDAQDLWNLKPDSALRNGALPLTNERWEELGSGNNVLYIPKGEVKKIHGRGYVKEKGSGRYVPANDSVEKVWNFFARGQVNVDDYARMAGEELGFDEIMKVFFDRNKYDSPVMRAWIVGGVGDDLRSNAYGYVSLNGDARLIGVRSESAEGVAQIPAETGAIKTYTPEDVEKAKGALRTLRSVVRDEHLSPLEILVGKL